MKLNPFPFSAFVLAKLRLSEAFDVMRLTGMAKSCLEENATSPGMERTWKNHWRVWVETKTNTYLFWLNANLSEAANTYICWMWRTEHSAFTGSTALSCRMLVQSSFALFWSWVISFGIGSRFSDVARQKAGSNNCLQAHHNNLCHFAAMFLLSLCDPCLALWKLLTFLDEPITWTWMTYVASEASKTKSHCWWYWH